MKPVGRLLITVAWIAGIAHASAQAQAPAQTSTLTVADRGSSKTYSLRDLLADRNLGIIAIADDPVYRRSMTYRAISMTDLLKGLTARDGDYVQARAVDDFSVGIPVALLANGTPAKAEAFVAVEDPAAPWPAMPGTTKDNGKNGSAGPFYIVWRTAPGVAISSEYWAYHLAALTIGDSPFKRWPGLDVSADVAAADPVRRGLDRFVAVCMACHRFDGAGEGEQGPDLGRPMNPVDYFQPGALREYIRNPASVRTWPGQKMPAFTAATLSDSDIDAIVAWLSYKSAHRR